MFPSMARTISSRESGWIFVQKGDARHDHARGTVAALHGSDVQKGFLKGMKLPLVLEAFDGRELLASRTERRE